LDADFEQGLRDSRSRSDVKSDFGAADIVIDENAD
jgi:hypothetical protein